MEIIHANQVNDVHMNQETKGQSALGRPIHETKTKYGLVRIGPLFENGAPQRQAVGTFDVCLVRPKVCPTDIVRPHAARLMIDTSVHQFCKMWPSADWPKVNTEPLGLFDTLEWLASCSS